MTPAHAHPAAPEPAALTPEELAAFLADGLNRPLVLRVTRNRVSLMRLAEKPDGALALRVHAALLQAAPPTLRALKRYLVGRRPADWQAVAAFLRTAPRDARAAAPPRPLRAAGRVHDLERLLREVEAAFFPDAPPCRIAWGRDAAPRRGRPRRHIAYGSYRRDQDLIRIHPRLDTPRVPREFVAFIVYHERLHAALGAETRLGRTRHHTALFRIRERQFPDYPRWRRLARDLVRALDMPAPDAS